MRLRLILTVVAVIVQLAPSSGVTLNKDGGYEIVVALDESVPVPSGGAARYIDNLKTSLRAFSSRLWVATKTHFYIKSVDILVPSHWDLDSASSATSQSYETADIRLSLNTTHPQVDNPNLCGQPGNFIDLPSSFFQTTHSGPYGLHWKSLLHSWAMYRFGVHPEHGYVGDSKYPYASLNEECGQFEVTGCSNAPIQGKFENIADPNDDSCETGNPDSDICRFVPSVLGQTATSSLMHFHWIESVTEFCDSHNHNIHAKNKQNALCDHKSVWEVIRESVDFKAVTSPSNISIPAITMKTWKHSATPVLYVLLDRGMVQGAYSIAQNIPRLLSNLLNDQNLKDTVASIGAFPGTNGEPVTELVPWSSLGENGAAFMDAVGQLRVDGPLERDFSKALVAVAEMIKAKKHPNGAVALLVKYGADVKSFGGYLPEAEVFNAFNEGNIIFNSIELNFPDHTGYSHLANVARETKGTYAVVSNFGEAEAGIRNVLNYVRRTLITEYVELKKNWKTLRRETLTTSTTLQISNSLDGPLQFFVSSQIPSLTASNFSVTGSSITGESSLLPVRVSKTEDWNEAGSQFTYRVEVSKDKLLDTSQVNLRILCGAMSCSSSILVRAEVSDNAEVKVEVFTSMENTQADLSNGRPVSIFAKVTKNKIPVQDALVIATLTDTLSSRVTTLRLIDDGLLTPDVQDLDGIYSAYFAPESDGTFRLAVTVQGNPSRALAPKRIPESVFARLLPIDQGDTGCAVASCESAIIGGNFTETVELPTTFSVIKTSLYTPSPNKIVSLIAIDRPAYNQVTLFWQSPIIPGRLHTVNSYELRSASSFGALVSDFEGQTMIPLPPNFRPKPPLSIETTILASRPSVTTYYAIRSVFRNTTSSTSNIVSVVIEGSPTTAPPAGSTTTPSASTGNPGPTTTTEAVTPGPTGSTGAVTGGPTTTTEAVTQGPTGSTGPVTGGPTGIVSQEPPGTTGAVTEEDTAKPPTDTTPSDNSNDKSSAANLSSYFAMFIIAAVTSFATI